MNMLYVPTHFFIYWLDLCIHLFFKEHLRLILNCFSTEEKFICKVLCPIFKFTQIYYFLTWPFSNWPSWFDYFSTFYWFGKAFLETILGTTLTLCVYFKDTFLFVNWKLAFLVSLNLKVLQNFSTLSAMRNF